jgi:hypothetical protein
MSVFLLHYFSITLPKGYNFKNLGRHQNKILKNDIISITTFCTTLAFKSKSSEVKGTRKGIKNFTCVHQACACQSVCVAVALTCQYITSLKKMLCIKFQILFNLFEEK